MSRGVVPLRRALENIERPALFQGLVFEPKRDIDERRL